MASTRPNVDTLPLELFAVVTDFLLGTELLSLSHVNRVLLTELLASDDEIWRRRAPPSTDTTHIVSAKQRYCVSRAYHFAGNLQGPGGLIVHGGAIVLPNRVVDACSHSSFSISVWFAMQPSHPDAHTTRNGGNLLSAQSIQYRGSGRPQCCQQFIHVNPNGDLYCSVTDDKRIVASGLQPKRWYHVVLTFTQSERGDSVQNVYFDGRLVDRATGDRHHAWLLMTCWQIGGGCGGPRLPCEYRWGWYAFRGLIDDFTVRSSVLSPEQIQREHHLGATTGNAFVWSLQGDHGSAVFTGDVKRVRCSRPQEVHVGGVSASVEIQDRKRMQDPRSNARQPHAAPAY